MAALVFKRISECGVIGLMMWVVASSLKGKWSYHEPPFSKRKLEIIVVVFTNKYIMDGKSFFFYVFPGTIVQIQNYCCVFISKLF